MTEEERGAIFSGATACLFAEEKGGARVRLEVGLGGAEVREQCAGEGREGLEASF